MLEAQYRGGHGQRGLCALSGAFSRNPSWLPPDLLLLSRLSQFSFLAGYRHVTSPAVTYVTLIELFSLYFSTL